MRHGFSGGICYRLHRFGARVVSATCGLQMPARGSRPIELRVSCIFSLPVEPRRNTAQVARMAPRETPLPVVCDFGDFRRVPEVLIADG